MESRRCELPILREVRRDDGRNVAGIDQSRDSAEEARLGTLLVGESRTGELLFDLQIAGSQSRARTALVGRAFRA